MGTPSNAEIKRRLFEAIEVLSVERLKSVVNHDKLQNVVMKSINEDFSYDHWICSLLFATAGITVSFSIHFTTKNARTLALAAFGDKGREMSGASVHDLIKEYANLVMGGVRSSLQTMLEPNQPPRGDVVLPQLEPSYDLVRFDGKQDAKGRHMWRIRWDGGELFLSANVQLAKDFNPKKLQGFDASALNISNTGDVEFL